MKVLITGSEGALGVPLKTELRRRGHQVFGCDLRHVADPQVMRADIANSRELGCVFGEFAPEIVVHLAGEFGRKNGQNYYERMWTTNVIGTRNVIEWCLGQHTPLLFASSSEAYGTLADKVAILDESLLRDFVPSFHNEYALSKWTGEKQIEIACRNHGLRACSFRYFNAYGPGEFYSPYRSVVCLFVYRLLHRLPITITRDGYRDFLYIDDWAATMSNAVGLYGDPSMCETAYNIGGNAFHSVVEMARMAYRLCGYGDPDSGDNSRLLIYQGTETGNIASKRPSTFLAERDLGHAPKVGLEEGLKRTIAWMRQVYAESIAVANRTGGVAQ